MRENSMTLHASITAAEEGAVLPSSRSSTMESRAWIHRVACSTAPAATVLPRAIVGAVFLLEGILKFVNPEELGVGRFIKIGIPYPAFFAPFDGMFEIACGILLILGLLTRLSAIPMIINMIVAITSTKIPMLLNMGFWRAAHEARLDFTMLLGCIFLLLVGGGPVSVDSLLTAPSGDKPTDSHRTEDRN